MVGASRDKHELLARYALGRVTVRKPLPYVQP